MQMERNERDMKWQLCEASSFLGLNEKEERRGGRVICCELTSASRAASAVAFNKNQERTFTSEQRRNNGRRSSPPLLFAFNCSPLGSAAGCRPRFFFILFVFVLPLSLSSCPWNLWIWQGQCVIVGQFTRHRWMDGRVHAYIFHVI